jgi:ribosome-associated toxin RatA of RatAB toxin-antitoxin module
VPTVEVSLRLAVPVLDAWQTIVDVESYPLRMENVQSVRLLDADRGTEQQEYRRAAWSVLLRGSVLQWVEREYLDPASHTIRFEQESGDLDRFDGYWTVAVIDELHSLVTLRVEFDIGIPLLADMLNPIATTALHDNAVVMLRALERAPTEASP